MSVTYCYSTGHIPQVISELRRAIGQYARGDSYIKIGITGRDPAVRWKEHQKQWDKDSAWDLMVVIFKSRSWERAREVERVLVEDGLKRRYGQMLNDVGGGGGRQVQSSSCYYVYCLIDRKKYDDADELIPPPSPDQVETIVDVTS